MSSSASTTTPSSARHRKLEPIGQETAKRAGGDATAAQHVVSEHSAPSFCIAEKEAEMARCSRSCGDSADDVVSDVDYTGSMSLEEAKDACRAPWRRSVSDAVDTLNQWHSTQDIEGAPGPAWDRVVSDSGPSLKPLLEQEDAIATSPTWGRTVSDDSPQRKRSLSSKRSGRRRWVQNGDVRTAAEDLLLEKPAFSRGSSVERVKAQDDSMTATKFDTDALVDALVTLKSKPNTPESIGNGSQGWS